MKAKKDTKFLGIDYSNSEDINMNQDSMYMGSSYSPEHYYGGVSNKNAKETSMLDENTNSMDNNLARPLTQLSNLPGPPLTP